MSKTRSCVVLSHPRADKLAIRQLATGRARPDMLPWLDPDHLRRGTQSDAQPTRAIRAGVAAVVLVVLRVPRVHMALDQDLRTAVELEAKSEAPRRCIPPLLAGLTQEELRRDPRLQRWSRGAGAAACTSWPASGRTRSPTGSTRPPGICRVWALPVS